MTRRRAGARGGRALPAGPGRAPGTLGVLVALVSVVAVVAVVGAAGPAAAAGYRYWSFWQLDRGGTGGHWVYATQGPSTTRPADGTVAGFRFAVSEDSARAKRPRGGHDFATICADTPRKPGAKRVALVLDFGTAADAPHGEHPPEPRTACVPLTEDATAGDALAEVAAPLRYNSAMLLCAIAGYPHSGCGEQVADPEPSGERTAQAAKDSGTASGQSGSGHHLPSASVLVGVAAVVLLGLAAVRQARRRRG